MALKPTSRIGAILRFLVRSSVGSIVNHLRLAGLAPALDVAYQSHFSLYCAMLYFGSGAFHQQKVLAMGVRIADPATISWIWHDAALDGVQIEWAPNGDMAVVFLTELNAEEDRTGLITLGIAARFVSIHFGMVWRFQTESTGDYAGRPTIDRWDVRMQSSFLAHVNERRPPLSGLLHHHITTSSGATFDIVGSDIQIAARETPINAGQPTNGSFDSPSEL